MANESSVAKGFGVTCGIIMAILVAGTLVMFLFCGGCGAFIGGGSAVIKEGVDTARRAADEQKARAEAEAANAQPATPTEPQPGTDPATVDEQPPSDVTPDAK